MSMPCACVCACSPAPLSRVLPRRSAVDGRETEQTDREGRERREKKRAGRGGASERGSGEEYKMSKE